MNTEKIRGALESMKGEIAENGSMWGFTKANLNGRIDAILAELDKAQQPGKVLTDEHYRIIADRMIEEHRKYGDRLRPGHWADVAARKVASHLADFGYLAPAAGLTVEEAEECLVEHLAQYGPDWSAPARSRLRARLAAAIEAKTRTA